jgi:outer membrane protein
VIAAAASPALAQQAPAASPAAASYKIGFVSTERVTRESRTSLQMQKNLEAEFEKRAREIDAGPKGDIERRKALLAEDMNAKREDAIRQFIDKTNGIIRRVAEAEKFDAVFLEAAYFSTRIDITERVIKAVDAAR